MINDLDDSIGFDEPVADTPEVTIAKQENALAIAENLDSVKNSLNEFDIVVAGLAELEKRFPKDAIYPVETTKGMKDAIEHRAAYRDPRVKVSKIRQMAKAPVLALGKNIDARAAWITEQLRAGEEPVDQQIKAEEKRKEEAKRAAEEEKMRRVTRIHEALAEISQDVLIACGKTSVEVQALIETMSSTAPDESVFEEFMPQAKEAWAAGLIKLETTLKAKLWDEAEAERIAKAKAEAEERQREEAARLEAQRIENERIAEEQRKENEAIAEERRKLAAERERIEQQEIQRAMNERAAEERRKARVQARFDRYAQLLTYDERTASVEINTSLTRLDHNAPKNDDFDYGDRLPEAIAKHDDVVDHLRTIFPLAVQREQEEEAARLADEAAAARAAEQAAAEEAARTRVWSFEITSMVDLVQHIAENPDLIGLIKPDSIAIIDHIQHDRGGLPGVTAFAN